jgi:hypothetical protein
LEKTSCNLWEAISNRKKPPATCGNSFPVGKTLLQLAGNNFQPEKPFCNLRGMISGWKNLSTICGTQFPTGKPFPQSAGNNFHIFLKKQAFSKKNVYLHW